MGVIGASWGMHAFVEYPRHGLPLLKMSPRPGAGRTTPVLSLRHGGSGTRTGVGARRRRPGSRRFHLDPDPRCDGEGRRDPAEIEIRPPIRTPDGGGTDSGGYAVSVLLVGMSHRSAPVSMLERVSVADTDQPKTLARLLSEDAVSEAMLVSTCKIGRAAWRERV